MASDQARMLEAARAERLWPRPPPWVSALGAAMAALLLAYPFIFTSSFSHHMMTLILLYALMAQSWNVVAGFSGQISLGQFAFAGVGAVTTGGLLANTGADLFLALAISGFAGNWWSPLTPPNRTMQPGRSC